MAQDYAVPRATSFEPQAEMPRPPRRRRNQATTSRHPSRQKAYGLGLCRAAEGGAEPQVTCRPKLSQTNSQLACTNITDFKTEDVNFEMEMKIGGRMEDFVVPKAIIIKNHRKPCDYEKETLKKTLNDGIQPSIKQNEV